MPKSLCSISLLLLILLTLPAPAEKAPAKIGDYVRYQKTSPAKLETAIVTMRAPGGQSLDLVSAVHLGEASYYQALNTRFKSYDAVLYELILPEEVAGQRLPSKMEASGALSGMQGMMGRALGLTTQLDNIDYSPKNFVHADLTQEGLSRSMAARQESLMTYFQKLLLSSNSTGATTDLGVTEQELATLDFMAILSGTATAKDRRTLKKIMATTMTSSDGAMNALGDTALLNERNKAALKVVDTQVAAGKRKMALFYGAAHMPELETSLTKKGWKRVGATWIDAWTI
jgi:hypothetical protein